MPEVEMSVRLISCTQLAPALCGVAARTCYGSDVLPGLNYNENRKCRSALSNALESGHESVVEHASFTFYVTGVSRALLAQITRHRIASFSVQSQRYVSNGDDFKYIVPPAISSLGPEYEDKYAKQMRMIGEWYLGWQKLLGGKGEKANEDARFVLPNAAATQFVVTMNARELLHFFKLRCCERAQWEIRKLAREMLKLCKEEAPEIFDKAGPPCKTGSCPEGMRTCGKAWDGKDVRK